MDFLTFFQGGNLSVDQLVSRSEQSTESSRVECLKKSRIRSWLDPPGGRAPGRGCAGGLADKLGKVAAVRPEADWRNRNAGYGNPRKNEDGFVAGTRRTAAPQAGRRCPGQRIPGLNSETTSLDEQGRRAETRPSAPRLGQGARVPRSSGARAFALRLRISHPLACRPGHAFPRRLSLPLPRG